MKRLEPFKKGNPSGTWEDWIGAAYFNRVNLCAYGFYELVFTSETDKINKTLLIKTAFFVIDVIHQNGHKF